MVVAVRLRVVHSQCVMDVHFLTIDLCSYSTTLTETVYRQMDRAVPNSTCVTWPGRDDSQWEASTEAVFSLEKTVGSPPVWKPTLNMTNHLKYADLSLSGKCWISSETVCAGVCVSECVCACVSGGQGTNPECTAYTEALLCGFLTRSFFFFLLSFCTTARRRGAHTVPRGYRLPCWTGMIMRSHANRIFIGCHISAGLHEGNAETVRQRLRRIRVRNSTRASRWDVWVLVSACSILFPAGEKWSHSKTRAVHSVCN